MSAMPPIAENRTRGTVASSHHQPLMSCQDPEASPTFQGDEQDELNDPSPQAEHLKRVPQGSKAITALESYSINREAALQCFRLEPCLYSPRMLTQAAAILCSLSKERSGTTTTTQGVPGAKDRRQSSPALHVSGGKEMASSIPALVFEGAEEKKRTFELALSALNYQNVLEDILEDCEFYKLNPTLKAERALVTVLLWDYQSRKFQPRHWEGREGGKKDDDKEMQEGRLMGQIEAAILRQQTKLKACLARRRIKASAPKIEFLLPDRVRHRSSCAQHPLPTCAWVNTLKTSMDNVLEALKAGGFIQIPTPLSLGSDGAQLEIELQGDGGGIAGGGEIGKGGRGVGGSFYLDAHCKDVLVFSADCWSSLHLHPLVSQGHLICQDKSSCLAAHSLVPLSSEHRDVMVLNPGAGWVAAHVAVLVKDRPAVNVVVVSLQDDQEHAKMMKNLQFVGVTRNVKVVREEVCRLEKDDSRLKNVTAALLIADCSKSAITNIVHYVVTEGEDLKMLNTVTEPEDMEKHIAELQAKHVASLRHLLSMTKLWGVAYLTRSVHAGENEAVVEKSLEDANSMQQQEQATSVSTYSSFSFTNGPNTISNITHKPLPWMVMAPGLAFSPRDMDCPGRNGEGQGGILQDKYIRLKPSEQSNGCFLVCLARRPEDPASVIVQARQKGLVGKPHKHKKHSTNTGVDDQRADADYADRDPQGHRRVNDNTNDAERRGYGLTVDRGHQHGYWRGCVEGHICQHGSRKGSLCKPQASLKAVRRLSSPVRPPVLKVMDYKVPDHQMVVYHPSPFK